VALVVVGGARGGAPGGAWGGRGTADKRGGAPCLDTDPAPRARAVPRRSVCRGGWLGACPPPLRPPALPPCPLPRAAAAGGGARGSAPLRARGGCPPHAPRGRQRPAGGPRASPRRQRPTRRRRRRQRPRLSADGGPVGGGGSHGGAPGGGGPTTHGRLTAARHGRAAGPDRRRPPTGAGGAGSPAAAAKGKSGRVSGRSGRLAPRSRRGRDARGSTKKWTKQGEWARTAAGTAARGGRTQTRHALTTDRPHKQTHRGPTPLLREDRSTRNKTGRQACQSPRHPRKKNTHARSTHTKAGNASNKAPSRRTPNPPPPHAPLSLRIAARAWRRRVRLASSPIRRPRSPPSSAKSVAMSASARRVYNSVSIRA